jgi:hypothetical protein
MMCAEHVVGWIIRLMLAHGNKLKLKDAVHKACFLYTFRMEGKLLYLLSMLMVEKVLHITSAHTYTPSKTREMHICISSKH